jgi:hypothetical protein
VAPRPCDVAACRYPPRGYVITEYLLRIPTLASHCAVRACRPGAARPTAHRTCPGSRASASGRRAVRDTIQRRPPVVMTAATPRDDHLTRPWSHAAQRVSRCARFICTVRSKIGPRRSHSINLTCSIARALVAMSIPPPSDLFFEDSMNSAEPRCSSNSPFLYLSMTFFPRDCT